MSATQQGGGKLPQDERAAFEAWITDLFMEAYGKPPSFAKHDGSGNFYEDYRVSNAWTAWQARANLAQRAASVPDAGPCPHADKTHGYDNVECIDCGAFKADTDEDWGVAAGKWFANRAQASFFRDHGRLPDNPAVPTHQEK